MLLLLCIFFVKETIDILPVGRLSQVWIGAIISHFFTFITLYIKSIWRWTSLTLNPNWHLYSSQLIVSFPSGLWLVHWRSTSSFTYLGGVSLSFFFFNHLVNDQRALSLFTTSDQTWSGWTLSTWPAHPHWQCRRHPHQSCLAVLSNCFKKSKFTCPLSPQVFADFPLVKDRQILRPGLHQGMPRGRSHGRGHHDARDTYI